MPSTTTKSDAAHYLNLFFAEMSKSPRPNDLSHYNPDPTDVIIVTYPKAGTTLLRNMAYQVAVATGGAPPFDPDGTNFKDLAEVAPWLEFGPEFGVLECPSSPRIFKSHLQASAFDKNKSKFIFCVRNPLDFPASALDFLFEPMVGKLVTDQIVRQEILNEFARRILLGRAGERPTGTEGKGGKGGNPMAVGMWCEYLKGWIGEPHDNLLVLFYEEVKDDYATAAKQIAKFMGRELSEEAAETVAKRCNRKAMAGDERFQSAITVKGMGLPENAGITSVKMERREGFKSFKLDEDIVKSFEKMLSESFGVANYDEFCLKMKELHKR